MTDVTNSETEAEARERLAKAVESFDYDALLRENLRSDKPTPLAEEEARELSDQVLQAMGWKGYRRQDDPHEMEWYGPNGEYEMEMHPLRNAQDALDLLPASWFLAVEQGQHDWLAALYCQPTADEDTRDVYANAKTIQAAITAAALRAG